MAFSVPSDWKPEYEEIGVLEFLKRAEEDPVEPVVFCAVVGNPESRPSISTELGITASCLGTCNSSELLAVSGSRNVLGK